MTDKEMALQITLKAIESSMIFKDNGDTRKDMNINTAESIGDFFVTVYKKVSNSDKLIDEEE